MANLISSLWCFTNRKRPLYDSSASSVFGRVQKRRRLSEWGLR